MDQLSLFIKSRVAVSDNELQAILSKFKSKSFDKGQFILRRGQIARHYYYLHSGALRFCYGEAEQENTAWLALQNEFFTEISSLSPQVPTRFNIEAIEASEILYIDKDDMEALYKQFPVWQEFGRKLWEAMSVRMIDQIVSFQTLSAEDRYLEFMKTPQFIRRVPVKYLASFLGITASSLSRIRKNIK